MFIALFFVNIIFLSLFFLFYLIFCPVIKEAKKSLKISKGGNQNPYIEEEQTTQWPTEREQTTIYKT